MPPLGNFLTEMHTAENCRSEYHFPKIFNRVALGVWEEAGSRELNKRAQDHALHILETSQPEPLAEDIQKELDTIYAAINKQKKDCPMGF